MKAGLLAAVGLTALIGAAPLAVAQTTQTAPATPAQPPAAVAPATPATPPMAAPATRPADATTGTPATGAAPGAVGGGRPAVTTPQTTAVTPGAATTAAGVPLTRVSNLIGTDLVGPNDEKMGEIGNLLIDQSGNVRAMVVEWGGFLGLGEKQALVPVDRIQLGAGERDRARISMTKEQLEALPRYDRNRLAEYGREFGWGEGLRWHRD